MPISPFRKYCLLLCLILCPRWSEGFADDEVNLAGLRADDEKVVQVCDSLAAAAVSVDFSSMLIDSILNFSQKYLGTPYGRGGKGPKRFDCSGFAGFVYRNFGYSLAASSSAQAVGAAIIPREQLKRGDLIFFKGRNSKSDRVGHVGIVMSNDENGNVRFIHSDFQGGVRIDELDKSPYYSTRYVTGRTIVGADQ